ncbi:MAG: hypothetical protein J6P72_07140 [Firmicutes bacterium]|nr:hypothetical protein [Bacillota bacterium]
MSYRLIKRDLKRILKVKNLWMFVFFLISSALCYGNAAILQISPSWLDYILAVFAGRYPVEVNISQPFSDLPPLHWLVSVEGILFLSLDYPLEDLSGEGMQILLRAGSKRKWYLSKCVWNVCNCLVYFLFMLFSGLIWTLFSKGILSLKDYTDVSNMVYEWSIDPDIVTIQMLWISGILMPFLTVAALNLFQMSLCLYTKPVFAFMVTTAALIISDYYESPYFIGNLGMGIRVLAYLESGYSVIQLMIIPLVWVCVSVVAGSIRCRRMDILSRED